MQTEREIESCCLSPLVTTLKAAITVLVILLVEEGAARATVRYVDASNSAPAPPYTTWGTAARVIQDAVEAAVGGDEIVVTNGIYAVGGVAGWARVVIEKPLKLRSVNGPRVTVIDGARAGRCVSLRGAVLNGFTLTGGKAPRYEYGGGVLCPDEDGVVINCILNNNEADYGAGAVGATLYSCTLSSNTASFYGGGAYFCTLKNCTLVGNSGGQYGGGAYSSTLNNCVLWYNTAWGWGPNYAQATLSYCCTAPQPLTGTGNITNDPSFVSRETGDFRLQMTSACINAGNNLYAGGTVDLDGNPRVCFGTVDIGAYEFQYSGPPRILREPFDQGVYQKSNVTFTVVGVGSEPLFCQWHFKGLPIPGATNWSLTLTAVDADRAGRYSITITNSLGSISSKEATLTVWTVTQTRYVWQDSPSPASPYVTWTTAAHTIQDAVDVAAAGDEVLVTNGIYRTGGRVSGTNLLPNRVAIDKPVTVRSANGPELTFISGGPELRCAYLGNGAVLSGFTLANGSAAIPSMGYSTPEDTWTTGGGVWCQSEAALVTNCVLKSNSAMFGGGARGGRLSHCTFSANLAVVASDGIIWYGGSGGGAYGSILNNCILTDNSAFYGAGAYGGTLKNCTLTGNSASGQTHYGNVGQGGGAFGSKLYNCIVYYNSALVSGANYDGTSSLAYCCTTPALLGGAGNTSLDPKFMGTGNFRLQADSPCINAGNNAYVPEPTDFDGNPRIFGSNVDIGAYECQSLTAPVVTLHPVQQAALPGDQVVFSVQAYGPPPLRCQWQLNGAPIPGATNWSLTLTAVTTNSAGIYSAVVSNPQGSVRSADAWLVVWSRPGTNYVWQDSPSPTPPYDSWVTAAHSIQDAVDASVSGGLVIVTNGIYATGGRPATGAVTTNRVVVEKAITLRSVNGPAATIIGGSKSVGDAAVRCVYLGSGSVLSGFTLTNGATLGAGTPLPEQSGGGVWCASTSAAVTNCVLSGNSAIIAGGAYGGTIDSSTLSGNSAVTSGGGAYGATLNNCVLVGNYASALIHSDRYSGEGGGAYACTLNNSTIFANTAGANGGGAYGGALHNCTLTVNRVLDWYVGRGGGTCNSTVINCILYYNQRGVMPGLVDNSYDDSLSYCWTNDPQFIIPPPLYSFPVLVADLRLQSNSPCINSGNNTYVLWTTDLDGNPRIVGSSVDIGAYEVQSPGEVAFGPWLHFYGLRTDGSADYTDADADGQNNWQEWRCQTDPSNPNSALLLLSPTAVGNNVTIRWQSVPGVAYFVEASSNLSPGSVFTVVATNIAAQGAVSGYSNTQASRDLPQFYRVGVGN